MDEFLESDFFEQSSQAYANMETPFDGLDPSASANSLLNPAATTNALLNAHTANPAPPTPTVQEPALDFLRSDAAPDTSNVQNGLLFQESLRPPAPTSNVRVSPPSSSISPADEPVMSSFTADLERSMSAMHNTRNLHNGPVATSAPSPRAPAASAALQFAPPPVDTARRRLRPVADNLISRCWKAAHSPAAFVAEVRSEMHVEKEFPETTGPAASPRSKAENSPAKSPSKSPIRSPPVGSKKRPREDDVSGAPDPKRKKDDDSTREMKRNFSGWTLDKNAEGALLDALLSRLCSGEASSARLMGYLRHALLSGLVSSQAVIAICVSTIATTPNVSSRALQSISKLMCELLPHYRFTSFGDALTTECTNYLDAFAMVLRCAVNAPYFSKELVDLLSMNRVIALVRACSRRVPSRWQPISAAIATLETKGGDNSGSPASVQATLRALSVSPELEPQLSKLKLGLAKGCTSFATIAAAAGKAQLPAETSGLSGAVPFAVQVAAHFLGSRIGRALQSIWLKGTMKHGDLNAFLDIEHEVVQQAAQGPAPSLALRDTVRACESIVRFLAERSARPEWNTPWQTQWGGKKRLIAILRDIVPQIRAEIQSELGCIVISMAIVGCIAMCLGPSLRLHDPNRRATDAASAAKRVEMDGEIASVMGDFAGYAVGVMEEAAAAEETPLWRSFGLWVLLFASRCGALLPASGCQEVRAAKVLRAWGGMPTGTPGAHAGGAHRGGSSGQGGSGSSSSSAMSAVAEVVAVFATPAAHAIIDVADVSGSDVTLHALCCDYIQ